MTKAKYILIENALIGAVTTLTENLKIEHAQLVPGMVEALINFQQCAMIDDENENENEDEECSDCECSCNCSK